MRPKDKISFLDILNENLRENPFYAKLFDTVGDILDRQIGEPLSQLARAKSSLHIKRGDYLEYEKNHSGKVAHVKRIIVDGKPMDEVTLGLSFGKSLTVTRRALQDRKILINSSTINGFDYYSDFLTDQDYSRINDYVSEYWSSGGAETPQFIKFLGFIKDMRLELQHLWTKDQGDFATSDDPSVNFYEYLVPEEEVLRPLSVGGDEYLTSHVDMVYDSIASPNPNFNDLINLFYMLAPIHLVLQRIVGALNVDVEVASAIVPYVDHYNTLVYQWVPSTEISGITVNPKPNLSFYTFSSLFLNEQYEEINPRYL